MSEFTRERLLRHLALKIQPKGLPWEISKLMEQLERDGALLLDEATLLAMYHRKPVESELFRDAQRRRLK